MNSSGNAQKSYTITPNFIQDLIQQNSTHPQLQFTDKKICTSTHSNLSLAINRKKVLQLAPKQQLSQIVYNLKSCDIVNKYEKQKRQSLRKQWIALKKQTCKISLNNQEIIDIHQADKTGSDRLFEGPFPEGAECNSKDYQKVQINQSKEDLQKRQENRKRSKTQMLIYDYELQKIGTLKLAHNLQQQCYNSSNSHNRSKKYIKQNPNIDQKNKTFSVKLGHCTLIKTQPKSKFYLQKVREAANANLSADKDPYTKRKLSTQSHKPVNEQQQLSNHCYTRSRNPISKSVMVQKIINLRKTFNDKYKKSPKKSFIQQSITQSGFNRQKQSTSQVEINSNGLIQYMSFPVMNIKEPKKLSFKQLFQEEKRKMELLKKYVNNGGVFNSFVPQSKDKQQQNFQNLVNLSQLSNSKSLYIQESQKPYSILHHGKIVSRPKAKWSEVQQQQMKTIKSKSKLVPQNVLNISSISILDSNQSLQNDLLQTSKQREKQHNNQQHITTYSFGDMNKHLQKPEIKQLRHKYLYSNKRRFSKQECSQYGISIVSVHDKDQTNLKKWKLKCKTQSIMEDCLDIEKKVPQYMDNNGKTSMNFVKTSYSRKKIGFMNKQVNLKQKQAKQHNQSFQPWQNQVSNQFGDEFIYDFAQD